MNEKVTRDEKGQRELATILEEYPEIIPDVTKYAQGWVDGRRSGNRKEKNGSG